MTQKEIIDELCRLRSDIVVAGGYVNRTDAQKNRFAQALSEGILRLQTEPYFWEKCPYYEPDIMFDGKEEYDWGKCTYKPEPWREEKQNES